MAPQYAEGSPLWVDLSSGDVAGSVEFYRQLMNWDVHDLGEPFGHYTMVSHQGSVVGAISPGYRERAVSGWTVFFKTLNATATRDAVVSAGGSVLIEPTDVVDRTTFAHYLDPTGALFGVTRPRKDPGAQKWGQLGSVWWIELHTPDTGRALAFYRKVLGWHTTAQRINGAAYTLLTAADHHDAFGGAHQVTDSFDDPRWITYLEVGDCDAATAKATLLGATIDLEPTTIPDTGRVAILTDPQGARFGLANRI